MFLITFSTVFGAIFQLFLVSATAGILVRKKIVSQSQIQSLSATTVNVFLPCLIIAKTVTTFDPFHFDLWWILPVAGILIVLIGLAFGVLLFRINTGKRHLLPMTSMQNGVYIVLPIGHLLYPDQFDLFALYCFLLIIGLSPMMWSVGKVLISGNGYDKIKWKDFVTPPLVATLISILLVFTGLSSFLPTSLLDSVSLLGQPTIPLAVFILGATFGTISYKDWPPIGDIMGVAVIKFILLPFTVFLVMYMTELYRTFPLISNLIIIQASSPPATNLILMVRKYGGDSQAIGSMMLIQYLLCLFVMPLWLSLWQLSIG